MNLLGTMRKQAQQVQQNIRQAFRAVAARNNHSGAQIGVEMEGLAGESVSGELMQHYGFVSGPLAGAEYIVIPVGGNTNHSVVIASGDGRYRLKVADGEVALYTDEGDSIHLKRGRTIEVKTETFVVNASTKVVLNTPLVDAAGEVKDRIRTMQADRELYNAHSHGPTPKPSPLQ
ncbi:phage baseplate assembly protein domain-containing protein [Pseudomonas mosselii]|uniref:phage baseplate assembly protein domain-containing protein n=1 Tax=Pseudomonas mosselii TaxID=78327 RepID=UPI000BB48DAB|nr:phage baseplate assembly protein [Pseudomonas mosselii]ATB63769.1 baseplate assembly protein [Pseudomonas mosselii]